jgi:hypothetical protein
MESFVVFRVLGEIDVLVIGGIIGACDSKSKKEN